MMAGIVVIVYPLHYPRHYPMLWNDWERDKGLVPVFRAGVEFYMNSW